MLNNSEIHLFFPMDPIERDGAELGEPLHRDVRAGQFGQVEGLHYRGGGVALEVDGVLREFLRSHALPEAATYEAAAQRAKEAPDGDEALGLILSCLVHEAAPQARTLYGLASLLLIRGDLQSAARIAGFLASGGSKDPRPGALAGFCHHLMGDAKGARQHLSRAIHAARNQERHQDIRRFAQRTLLRQQFRSDGQAASSAL